MLQFVYCCPLQTIKKLAASIEKLKSELTAAVARIPAAISNKYVAPNLAFKAVEASTAKASGSTVLVRSTKLVRNVTPSASITTASAAVATVPSSTSVADTTTSLEPKTEEAAAVVLPSGVVAAKLEVCILHIVKIGDVEGILRLWRLEIWRRHGYCEDFRGRYVENGIIGKTSRALSPGVLNMHRAEYIGGNQQPLDLSDIVSFVNWSLLFCFYVFNCMVIWFILTFSRSQSEFLNPKSWLYPPAPAH